MAIKNFAAMEELLRSGARSGRLGVIQAHDEHTLGAVAHAMEKGLITPTLIGDQPEIERIWTSLTDKPCPRVVHTLSEEESLDAAMLAVNLGQLDAVMKGKMETAAIMKAALNKETGIRAGEGGLSLVALMESPYYHKMFCITDVGLMTYPNFEQKVTLVKNAVESFHRLGYDCPKVAILTAVETVNPKMPETVDAAKLKEMNQSGELPGCLIEGPISYDLAMSAECARIKGYESPVAGDTDILIVPDIVVGNAVAKCITATGGGKTSGIVCGAKVPIIVTSRSAAEEDKYMSIVQAALVGRGV